jgi:hypothetical protein
LTDGIRARGWRGGRAQRKILIPPVNSFDRRYQSNDNKIAREIALVDELRAYPAEMPWIEFKATNASFRKRFGTIEPTAAQFSRVFSDARDAQLIKLADQAAPKSGYEPNWA